MLSMRRSVSHVIGLVSILLLVLAAVVGGRPGSTQSDGVRFVDGAGYPLASTRLRVLCYASADLTTFRTEYAVSTDADGFPTTPWPSGCDYLAALKPQHIQPSGKPGHGPAYTVYATSWPPDQANPVPASGDIVVRADWPLVLFHVVISLAWQPPPASPYLAELRAGLQAASAYLYDLTEGQMAFGPMRVGMGGEGWESADFRFLPANNTRPSAYVGGLIAARTPYTAPRTGQETIFAPGAIFLGRYWDGLTADNAADGAWDQPAAWRTLIHEWGHYALFLYDEYQQTWPGGDGKSSVYCVCLDLPASGCNASAMSYHYTANELWHPLEHGSPPVCLETGQAKLHGEADWETIAHWSALQGTPDEWLHIPIESLTTQTPGVVKHLFDRSPANSFLPFLQHSRGQPPPLSETALTVLTTEPVSDWDRRQMVPQVYWLSGDSPTSPDRLLDQGTTDNNRLLPNQLGLLLLFGVSPSARVRVFVDQYSSPLLTGQRWVYPAAVGDDPILGETATIRVAPDTRAASLDLTFNSLGPLVTTLTATLTTPTPLADPPTFQLCAPEAETGCPAAFPWHQTMAPANGGWSATFNAAPGQELPRYGLVRIQTPPAGEIIRWYQVAGGVGPGHMEADAPMLDGAAMIDTIMPLSSARNHVMLMLAADYAALTAPLPPGIAGIVGLPLDLDILLPPVITRPGDHPLPAAVLITLFYDQTLINRLDLNEHRLRLLHFNRVAGMWSEIPVSGQSDLLNWLTTTPMQVDGIYAIGWSS